jgi:hypothetical protein
MTDTVREWAPKFAEVNHLGAMHIVVEEWNLEDGHIKFCRNQIDATQAEIDLCNALQAMTWEERWATAITSEDSAFDPCLFS